MKSLQKSGFILLSALLLVTAGWAQDRQVYGWELMTEQERVEHRNKMRSFKTEKERERYRHEHHKKMQKRAKKKGLTLPDKPQQRGKGMGRGPGDGSGAGGGGRR